MQLTAITRKSALMAILLLVAMLVAVALRYCFAPFEFELANCEYRERIMSLVLAMFLYLCVGIIEGKMLPRSGLSRGYCTLPIPLYGLLACGVFFAPNALVAAVVSLCFAVAIYLLLRSLHVADEKESVFFASMLLGATVLLYPPSIVLVGVLPLAIFILALSLRQALLMIVAYPLPFLASSYIMWYRGSDFLQLGRNFVEALSISHIATIHHIPYMSIVLVVAIVVSLIWGAVYAFIRSEKMFMLARVRRALYLFLWVSLLTLTALFIPSCDLTICAVAAVPIAILLSFVLDILPNNHSTTLYWVLLALFVLHLFVE